MMLTANQMCVMLYTVNTEPYRGSGRKEDG